MRRWTLWLAVACMPAMAAEADDAMLPPAELVWRAIAGTPEVHGAEASVSRADAQARLLNGGSYEGQATVIPQRRRVEGDRAYNEWELEITRPIRLPGKARLDREIGSLGKDVARLDLEDAHHTAARRLLAAWADWQRARAARHQRERLAEIAQRDRDVVARRVALGDAAERERIAADAALAQAQAMLVEARRGQTQAELTWQSLFPALPLPQVEPGEDYAPPELVGNDAAWVAAIVARSHEIGASAALARQADAQARRVRADRVPDPTVGIRVINDLAGRERAYGVVLGLPLGGSYRSAEAASARADADAAEAGLAAMRRDIERDARLAVAMARANRALWASQRQALEGARQHAAKAARAYALGEAGIEDLLAARRAEREATLAEHQAAIDAFEAVTRVRVDAHELWHRHDGEATSPRDAGGLPALPALDG